MVVVIVVVVVSYFVASGGSSGKMLMAAIVVDFVIHTTGRTGLRPFAVHLQIQPTSVKKVPQQCGGNTDAT